MCVQTVTGSHDEFDFTNISAVHVSYLYPDPNDKARWKAIIKKINSKCRNIKNRNKSARSGSL